MSIYESNHTTTGYRLDYKIETSGHLWWKVVVHNWCVVEEYSVDIIYDPTYGNGGAEYYTKHRDSVLFRSEDKVKAESVLWDFRECFIGEQK